MKIIGLSKVFFGILAAQIVITNIVAMNSPTPSHADLFEELGRKTQDHIQYLSLIGLGERAKGIKLNWFKPPQDETNRLDLSSFNKRASIPQQVIDFDPNAKNTLITTDPYTSYNKPEDLQKILNIRLYPVLKNLIIQNSIQIFLGTKQEMYEYYKSNGAEILFEFEIPSSAIYYLAQSKTGKFFVVMSGLVSKENIIAQLLTLKLAGIKVEDIEIIGEVQHFNQLVRRDMDALISKIPELKNGNYILIVAGCGLEDTVNKIIQGEFTNQLSKPYHFRGDIISLTYTRIAKPVNDICGFISLNLNYGEIMEDITALFLENCNCKYVFTGGAGGFISNANNEQKPDIGSRISITQSMNEQGEIAKLDQKSVAMHLQIPSIFLETYDWLAKARQRGSSVDVETFYVIRAIQNYNSKNLSNKVSANCGYFVSDYVGEEPLRDYSNVYKNYPMILAQFLRECLKMG